MSDSTNSVKLIEDWREKWEERTKDGLHVMAVADFGEGRLEVWTTRGHGMMTTYGSVLIPKPQPKKLRPWKREEVPVGSVVRNKTDGVVSIIECVDNSASCISVPGLGWISPQFLFEDFVRHDLNPDGTWKPVEQCRPCGVEE